MTSHVQKSPKRDTVGVYLPNSPHPEAYRLSREQARDLRNSGLAFFIHRANDIKLTFTPEAILRGESCNIKENVILRWLDGSRTAGAAINAWA